MNLGAPGRAKKLKIARPVGLSAPIRATLCDLAERRPNFRFNPSRS
jgi:hypothetical protein